MNYKDRNSRSSKREKRRGRLVARWLDERIARDFQQNKRDRRKTRRRKRRQEVEKREREREREGEREREREGEGHISAATRVRELSLRGCVESKRGTSEGERADRVAEGRWARG